LAKRKRRNFGALVMHIKEVFKQEKPFFMLVPALLWQTLFFYAPLLFIGILSLLKFSDVGMYQGLTLENYLRFFSPTYFLIILKSLALAVTNGFLCFLLGYPLAYFISFKTGRLKNLFLFLLILPFWTNFLLHIYAWFFVLDRGGFLNTALIWLGVLREPLHMLNSLAAVILLMVYSYLPFMVLPVYSILERFDRSLVEASADLGASPFQTVLRVVVPLSLPGILSGFALVFVPSFGEFAIPALMGGEKYLFVGSVISQYILANKTISFGAAFTVISSSVLLLFVGLVYVFMRKVVKWRVL
jgi:spermidine/putrescine transport system permease protein